MLSCGCHAYILGTPLSHMCLKSWSDYVYVHKLDRGRSKRFNRGRTNTLYEEKRQCLCAHAQAACVCNRGCVHCPPPYASMICMQWNMGWSQYLILYRLNLCKLYAHNYVHYIPFTNSTEGCVGVLYNMGLPHCFVKLMWHCKSKCYDCNYNNNTQFI